MTYEPDLRPPIGHLFSPLKFHPTDCPRSFPPEWENESTAAAYLDAALQRFSLTDRGLLIMPMGKIPGLFPSSQWHSGETWRQRLLLDKCNDWMRGKWGRTIEIFAGCRPAKSVYHLSMAGNRAPDPTDPAAMGGFVANTLPWVTGLKLHRLWLDTGSSPANYPSVRKLVPWCQALWGLQIGTEAFVTHIVGPGEWELDQQALLDQPGYCITKFLEVRDPNREWTVPSGAEAVVMLRHIDGPTQDLVDSLRSRGFVVGSTSPPCDQMVV